MKLSKLIPELKKGKCKYCGNKYWSDAVKTQKLVKVEL